MNFLSELKNNKGFRFKVVAFLIILVMMVNMNDTKKTATPSKETCDTYNTGGYIITTSGADGCESDECVVQYNTNPTSWYAEITDMLFGDWWVKMLGIQPDLATCVPLAATNKYVMASDSTDASNQCESQKASEKAIKDNWFDKDVYRCVTSTPDERCNSAEKGLASFAESIGLKFGTCKTRYYMVLGIGGIIVFMMIGMIL